ILLLNVEGSNANYRSSAGNAGFAHPKNSCARHHARMGYRATNSAGIEGCASDWTGVAVPRSPPAGVQGVDTGRVGSLGKQPQGEILFANQDWAEATAS